MTKKIKNIPSLLEVFDKVNNQYLGGLCIAGIRWARLSNNENYPCLGRVHPNTRIISINYTLQSPEVPSYVLESVVLHECLHLIYPAAMTKFEGYSSTETWHSYRFEALEKKYGLAEKADAWISEHYWGILASNRIRNSRKKKVAT